MSYIIPPLINGKSYEYADIIVNILGVPMVGITSIEYDNKQNMENIYGAGNKVVSRGYGKFEPTAKITLLMEEIENITSVAPLGSIQNIPEFDIVVIYLDAALVTRKHKLRNCRFMNNPRKSSTGDTSISCDVDLIISDVEYI
jgi:hypothetical protein